MKVSRRQVAENFVTQFFYVPEAAVAHDVDRQVAKEALYQIHPGSGRRREMYMKPWVLPRPFLYCRMLVSRGVAGNQMELQFCRRFAIDVPKKPQPLLMPMLFSQQRDNLPFQIIQRGE